MISAIDMSMLCTGSPCLTLLRTRLYTLYILVTKHYVNVVGTRADVVSVSWGIFIGQTGR